MNGKQSGLQVVSAKEQCASLSQQILLTEERFSADLPAWLALSRDLKIERQKFHHHVKEAARATLVRMEPLLQSTTSVGTLEAGLLTWGLAMEPFSTSLSLPTSKFF